MSDIDPRKAGKCWSCKFCEDVGTYRYEDSVFYMRKCNYSSKDYVGDCDHYCSEYIWDGETKEYWKERPGSYSSSSSSSSSSSGFGCIFGVLCIIGVLAIIAFFVANIADEFFDSGSADDTYITQVQDAEVSQTARVVPDAGLRLRNGPGTSYNKILTMQKGEVVTVIKTENGWAYVDYKGTKGWCSIEYLDMN